MSDFFLLVSSEPGLQLQIKACSPEARVDLIAMDADTALGSGILETAPSDAILVLAAQLPRSANLPPDREERAALWLLQELRNRGISRPALVITSRPMGIAELDEYCSPNNAAIALPLRKLDTSTLAAFVRMLRDAPNPPEPTWKVIEVEVNPPSIKCLLGDGKGRPIVWGEAKSTLHSAVQSLAFAYAQKPDFQQGWARRVHMDGAQLFRDLVISTLGPGLFSHLERAAGGLERLAFRFSVEDPRLYSAPFEATVRPSGLPFSGTMTDFTQDPFVLVNAPITRRIKGVTLSTAPARGSVSRPARLLFIRSQVGENPAGATLSDTVAVPEIDQAIGRIRIRQLEFRRLDNIDRELEELIKLQRRFPTTFSLDLLDLSKERDPEGAETVLKRKLAGSRYDVVHFAGHSLTTKDLLTLLVLPGEHLGEADGMAVATFADSAAAAGAQLVYLSSCQGSSANTVASLGQRSVPYVLGFRWDVEDDRAADFANWFYSELLSDKSATISAAFRAACRGVYEPMQVESSPIWASPILATRSDDWMAQRVL